jgi:hypothetical protein
MLRVVAAPAVVGLRPVTACIGLRLALPLDIGRDEMLAAGGPIPIDTGRSVRLPTPAARSHDDAWMRVLIPDATSELLR